MKIIMLKSMKGISRADGAETMTYEAGKEYKAEAKWQEAVFQYFMNNGAAHAIGGNVGPTETKAAPKKRGRPRKT